MNNNNGSRIAFIKLVHRSKDSNALTNVSPEFSGSTIPVILALTAGLLRADVGLEKNVVTEFTARASCSPSSVHSARTAS